MKQEPIRIGDRFTGRATTWEICEDLKFGRGYWVVSVPDRCRQTVMKRDQLDRMQRVTEAQKKVQVRMERIELAARSLLWKLDEITTEDFSKGGEQEERERLREALQVKAYVG